MLGHSEIIELIEAGAMTFEPPLAQEQIRGSSVCLTLAPQFVTIASASEIDVRDQQTYPQERAETVDSSKGYQIAPKTLVLAATAEAVSLPLDVCGYLSGLSGLARLGLQVVLSSLVAPGFGRDSPSTFTLELFNHLDAPVRVYPGMRICHLQLHRLSKPTDFLYDERIKTYSKQVGPRSSKFYGEFG